jgi:hypothetical protein
MIKLPDGQIQISKEALPACCRMNVPCRWGEGGLGKFAGRVRFRRRFGLPREIDPSERVWLTFAAVEERAAVWLNEQILGRELTDAFEFDVTALLQKRNLLTVEVESLAGDGGLCGEVALEVRRTAFLRKLRFWATLDGEAAQLHLTGEVAGESGRPLELYLLLDRFTVGYASEVLAGRPFHLTSESLPADRWRPWRSPSQVLVRVDLVEGASVWYTSEQLFQFPTQMQPTHKSM